MSKKYLVILLALAFAIPLFADIVLDQNFDGITPPNNPAGWVVRDYNVDGKTWVTTTSHPHTTPNCIRYNYSRTNAAKDWFFSNGVTLQNGISYTLEFFYDASNPTFPEQLRVWLTTSQDSWTKVGSPLWNNSSIINTVFAQGLADFTVPSTGTYYLGFNCYSPANMWNLRVDDIKIYKDVHDVGIDTIYSPLPGTYNKNSVLKPKFLVRNWGQNTGGEVVPVWSAFVRYPVTGPAETLRLQYHEVRVEICNPETVYCDSWIPPFPCNHKFIAWTALEGDQVPSNDKKEVSFSVDFRDVRPTAITIPYDTVLYCTESIPTAIVKNEGHQTESFWTFFKSKDSSGTQEYFDSTYVSALAAGQSRTITFKKWHFPPCNHTAIVYTTMPGDENIHNDTIIKPYVIKYYDMEAVSVVGIPDTTQVCNWFMPGIVVHNNGKHTGPQSAVVYMNVYRNGNLINAFQGATRLLNPCQYDTVRFEWHADSGCNHTIKSWISYAPDQNHANDTVWRNFVVKYYDVEAVPPIVGVPETVQVCNWIDAKVVVHNKGLHVGNQTGWVYFNLYRAPEQGPGDNGYTLIRQDSIQKTLVPCVYDTVTFRFHADSACYHKITAWVKYPNDQNPLNDSVQKYFIIKYRDFGVVSITGVPETLQVCTNFNPVVTVINNSRHVYPDSATVYLELYRNGQYYQGQHQHIFLAPYQSAQVGFEWHADSACNHTFKAYVEPKSGDQNPLNDTAWKNFVIKYYDVGAVSIINVPDTVVYCNTIYPKVVIRNNSVHTLAQTGWVFIKDYRNAVLVYQDSAYVTGSVPGHWDTLMFQYHPDTCNHQLVATVKFTDDQNPANDTVRKNFTVSYYDVEAVPPIVNLPDTVDYCNTINPKIVVHNKGVHVPT